MTTPIPQDYALEPCPFCGSAARRSTGGEGVNARYGTGCDGSSLCPAHLFALGYHTQAEADAAWNRRAPQPGWLPISEAPKEVELLGWREDCGPLLIMHTSYDRFASERECDQLDEDALFQKDWFGAGIPGGMERLEGSLLPTHFQFLPPPPSTKGEPT